jgi:hypothetical protein
MENHIWPKIYEQSKRRAGRATSAIPPGLIYPFPKSTDVSNHGLSRENGLRAILASASRCFLAAVMEGVSADRSFVPLKSPKSRNRFHI